MGSVMEQSQARVAQEALVTPVRDTGQSELLRGRFMGTQPFEKGLGFSHQDAHKAQVHTIVSSLYKIVYFCSPIRNVTHHCSSQRDEPVEFTSEHLSEEQFTDEHGNVVTKVGTSLSYRFSGRTGVMISFTLEHRCQTHGPATLHSAMAHLQFRRLKQLIVPTTQPFYTNLSLNQAYSILT